MSLDQRFRLPGIYEIDADIDWAAIDFISDLHLWAADEATFSAWQRYMATTAADAVFILGDLFEVWVGDDAASEPFERRCLEVLADASSRRRVGMMVGNRDFLVGASVLRERGVLPLSDPTRLLAWGQPVLLTHGDALCLADEAYQRFRAEVRTEAWRDQFLAKPLAQRQALAREMREASTRAQQARLEPFDADPAMCVAWMHQAGCRDLIHGHTHRPLTQGLAPGYTRHVLSDWALEAGPPRAEVMRLSRNGFTRLSLAQTA
jgi:UDP-2,3-diacylglucosamine hydrolase